jgi:hypothetical protein
LRQALCLLFPLAVLFLTAGVDKQGAMSVTSEPHTSSLKTRHLLRCPIQHYATKVDIMQELVAFSQVIATFLVAATLYVLWRQTCAMEANLEITQSQILDLQETQSRQHWSAFDFLENEVVKHTKDFKGFSQTDS